MIYHLRISLSKSEMNLRNKTPLMIACRYGSVESVRVLLERKAKPNTIINNKCAFSEMIKIINDEICKFEDEFNNLEEYLSLTDDLREKKLVEVEYSIKESGVRSIIEKTKLLIDYGFDVNQTIDQSSALEMAMNVDVRLVKFLLDQGANPNILHCYQYIIEQAIIKKDLELVKTLIDGGAKVFVNDYITIFDRFKDENFDQKIFQVIYDHVRLQESDYIIDFLHISGIIKYQKSVLKELVIQDNGLLTKTNRYGYTDG